MTIVPSSMACFLFVAQQLSLLLSATAMSIDRAAQSTHEVPFLPGYGVPKEHVYSGYVDVKEETDSQLFYIAYESRQPATADTPLLIWLNGGPGASSFLGNFLENGPYTIQGDGTFKDNPFAWNDKQHLVYVDNPVGTGFSHCNPGGHVKTQDEMAEQFIAGLKQLVQRHPQFSGPLYLTGESFSGMYIPYIGAHLVRHHDQGDRSVNFKGVLIGNPGLDMKLQYRLQPMFFRVRGLIDERVQNEADAMYRECEALLHRGEIAKAFWKCSDMSTFLSKEAGDPFLYNVGKWGDVFSEVYSPAMANYLATPEAASALHTGGEPWKNGDGTSAPNPVVNAMINDTMGSSSPRLAEILQGGYRAMIYSGAEDGSMCGTYPTEEALKEVGWSGRGEYEEARTVLWQAAGVGHPWGNARVGGGLTFVVVLNCGHMVPTDQPEAGLDLLHRFLDGASWTDLPEQSELSSAPVTARGSEGLIGAAPVFKGPEAEGGPWQTVLTLALGASLGALLTTVVSRQRCRSDSAASMTTEPLLA